MAIKYQFATSEEIEEKKITEFALEALNDSEMLPKFAENLGEDLVERISTADLGDFIIAVDSDLDQLIGYVELYPTQTENGLDYFIRGIYILPNFRQRGIARKLLRMAAERCKEKGAQLRVDAFTEKELNLYKNLGFEIQHYSLRLIM